MIELVDFNQCVFVFLRGPRVLVVKNP